MIEELSAIRRRKKNNQDIPLLQAGIYIASQQPEKGRDIQARRCGRERTREVAKRLGEGRLREYVDSGPAIDATYGAPPRRYYELVGYAVAIFTFV